MSIVRLMLLAQHKYVLTKIVDKKYKKAYIENIEPLIEEAHICADIIDYEMYVSVIKTGILNAKNPFYKSFFNSSKKEGINTAFEVVEDILASVDIRFISGGHKMYEFLLKECKYVKRK
jgi:hypothetical protein